MDVISRLVLRYGLAQMYKYMFGRGQVERGVDEGPAADVAVGGGVVNGVVDAGELSRDVSEFSDNAQNDGGDLAAVGGGSPNAAQGVGGRMRSSAHYATTWRYLVWSLNRQRRDVSAELEKRRRVALRFRSFATRVARAGYWRSVGPVAPREQAVQLDRSWGLRDLLPNWVQRFGVAEAQRVLAGRVTAAFLSLSPDEETTSDVRFHASAWDSFVSWFGGAHRRRHRASNRWAKRMAVLRKLREQLIFGAEGIRRVRSPVNDAWCSIQARKLVTEMVERGDIDARHSRWYRDALVTVFYLEDDDDVFFSAIGATSSDRIY